MKPPAYYRGKEQTYVKHFFLEQYLETLAFHIGFTKQEFVYVDCFSGPWHADDEDLADTSIRIALDRLNYVCDALAAQARCPLIRAIFVEKNPTAFASLQNALRHHSHSVRTAAFQGTLEDNIKNILHCVGQAFSFFFLDPTGWGFAMDDITPLLAHNPGEVMVNFMYDFINRFLNYPDPANEHSLDRFFGTTGWRDIRDATNREEASVHLYLEQLRTRGGFSYVTYTRVLKPLHERAYFHLAYATRSATGIRKFRDVERKTVTAQDQVRVNAQRERREARTGQGELCFAPTDALSTSVEETRLQQLRAATEKIYTLLRNAPMTYDRLEPLILELPYVWPADLHKIIMREHKYGQLVIEGLTPRQRAPKTGNIIRLEQDRSK